MRTKKEMAVLALIMAGMFVSAQTYMSPEEASMLEQSMLNAEATATSTNPLGYNFYDLLWGIYYNTPFCEQHPTSRHNYVSDSNDQEFIGVPSMYMRAAGDKDTPFPKYWTKPRPPRPTIDGLPNRDDRPVER